MVQGGPLVVEVDRLRVGADQRVQVAGLELVGHRGQTLQIGNPEVRRPGGEDVVKGEGAQGGVPAGRASPDRHPSAVDQTLLGEVTSRRDAILGVDHPPPAPQSVAVGPSMTARPPVVDVHQGESTAGPELACRQEGRVGRPGRPAVAPHQQRRKLVFRSQEVRVGGRVVEGVGDRPVGGGEGDRSRTADVGLIDLDRQRRPGDLFVAGFRVEADHRSGSRAAGCYQPDLPVSDRQRRHRVASSRDGRHLSALHHPQPVEAPTSVYGDDPPVGQEPVPLEPEQPLGRPELGLHRTQSRLRSVGLDPVEVPPSRPVGHEVERPVRTPLGLEDRFVRAAGNLGHVGQGTVGRQVGHPQFGSVPGHVGVIPGQPGEPLSPDTRSGEEVVSARYDPWRQRAVEGEEHQLVDGFRLGPVVLPHRQNQVTVEGEVGVAVAGRNGGLGSDRPRFGTIQPVDPLVFETRRHDQPVADREVATAVLVSPGSGVESGRRNIPEGAVGGEPNDHAAALLRRPRLDPVHVVAVHSHLVEADTGVGEHGRRDRRLPGSVGGNRGHARPFARPDATYRPLPPSPPDAGPQRPRTRGRMVGELPGRRSPTRYDSRSCAAPSFSWCSCWVSAGAPV